MTGPGINGNWGVFRMMARAWKRKGAIAAVLAGMAVGAAPAPAQTVGEPGTFDYYVLSLSWSPAFCAGRPADKQPEQCRATPRFGFIVHGLWPQHAKGGWPERCSAERRIPQAVIDRTLPLMPSKGLILHEWLKHGTCSGKNPADYFADVAAARARVTLPPEAASATPPAPVTVEVLRDRLLAVNPGLTVQGLALVCSGPRVAEVRLCLNRDLSFRACSPDVRTTCRRGAVLSGE